MQLSEEQLKGEHIGLLNKLDVRPISTLHSPVTFNFHCTDDKTGIVIFHLA